jgi:glycosyltransferase involved in cell wall biosynthesis
MVNVLLGNNYATTFNSPRSSIHTLIPTKFFPSKQFLRPLDSIGMWLPVRREYQLIHTFNRIPYTQKPWIVTFESILPRTIGPGKNIFKNLLRPRLELENCRKIIAISDYAKQKFINTNKDWEYLEEGLKKLMIIHPNICINSTFPKTYIEGQLLELVFVGNDFARKGGIIALRIANKAKQMKLPIQVHLLSQMKYGSSVYTDCLDSKRYDKDLSLMSLDNVIFHANKSNSVVMELLSKIHLQIMATLDDTYGYSVIEGFSVATPAITTNVCALPEIVHHGQNGYLLHLELNKNRNWVNLSHRESREYWDILDKTYDKLADDALQFIVGILDKPEEYEQLSVGAITQACTVHDSRKNSELLDSLYSSSV